MNMRLQQAGVVASGTSLRPKVLPVFQFLNAAIQPKTPAAAEKSLGAIANRAKRGGDSRVEDNAFIMDLEQQVRDYP